MVDQAKVQRHGIAPTRPGPDHHPTKRRSTAVVVSSVPRRGRDGDGADRAGQRDEVMLPRSHVAMNMRLGTTRSLSE